MAEQNYHPVILLPAEIEVFDFTQGYDPDRIRKTEYGIGRYAENRKGMYTQALFKGERTIHVGVDIAAPVGTAVHSFSDGWIAYLGVNPKPGDYGPTLVCGYDLDGRKLFALYGHLSGKSIEGKIPGMRLQKGSILGWVGDRHENGGWNPHLHFQLSRLDPRKADMPGAVSEADFEQAKLDYPDPRLVLGPIY